VNRDLIWFFKRCKWSDKYQLSFNEVSRRRISLNSQQFSVVGPGHEAKRNLVFTGGPCRTHLKHGDAMSVVAAVPVAFRLCRSNSSTARTRKISYVTNGSHISYMYYSLGLSGFVSHSLMYILIVWRHDLWCCIGIRRILVLRAKLRRGSKGQCLKCKSGGQELYVVWEPLPLNQGPLSLDHDSTATLWENSVGQTT